MIKPALYVGLGGAGIWTVANIKHRILKRENEIGVKFPNTYLVLDTDEGTIQNVKNQFGNDILNDATETVIYGKTCNPRREYEKMLDYREQGRLMQTSSAHRSMEKWIDEQVAREFPNDSLSKGASAERQKGRVGGLFSKQEIMHKLRHQIRLTTQLIFEYQQRYRAQSSQNDFSFPIYLISSCLGGSGSSMFLDVCKMISLVYRDVVAQSKGSGEADIQPIIYLPDPYLEKYQMDNPSLVSRYKSNAFAFFSEIDFFFHDRYFREQGKEGKRIYDLFFDSENDEVKSRIDLSWQPFKAGVLIDSQLVGVQFKDITQMYDIVAEMIAQLCTTPTAYNAIQSKFDNQKGQIGTNPELDEDKSLKLARAYATMGYRVLEFPTEPMQKYFFYRFRAEMFEGLIGKNYDRIQDAAFREKQLLTKVEQLERFIYADLANKSNTLELNNNKIPHNLEAALIREVMDNFSLERFYTEKALETGKEDFEKKKVSESELSYHFEEAKNLIQNFRSRANQVLEGVGPNSRQGIIAILKEELDQIFVDAVITFGVNYAIRLLERIDATLENKLTHALTKCQNTRAEQEKIRSEIVSLKSEVTAQAEKIIGLRWKEKLKEYHAKISSFIDIAREEYLLEVRIKLLEYLCKGDDGLLDKYESQASSLLQLLTTYYDGSSGRKGFRHEFETALLKEFQNTASLLTVQYLPNISEYVSSTGEWKDETLLTQLYEHFITIQKQPGEDKNKPIRYYVDELPDANQSAIPKDRLPSLSKRLHDILNRFGKDDFLKLVCPEVDSGQKDGLIERWIAISQDVVEEWMNTDSVVKEEFNKPLLERFNQLSEKDQQGIKKFFELYLKPLCPNNRMGDSPNRIVVIASDNKAFAERIYSNSGTVEYVEDPSLQNKVVGFILESGFTRNDFEQITSLRGIYHQYRETFRPHLWKVANDFGIQGLFGDVSQDLSLDWVSDALIYTFLLSKLPTESKEKLFFTAGSLGDEKTTMDGPISVQNDKGRNTYQFFYLTQLDTKETKLVVRKKFYQPLTSAKESYPDYVELLSQARRTRFNSDILDKFRDKFAHLMRHGDLSVHKIHEWILNDYLNEVLEKRLQRFNEIGQGEQVKAVETIINHIQKRVESLFPKPVQDSADNNESVLG